VIVVNDALMCPDTFFYGVSHGADKGIGGVSLVEHAVLRHGHAVWIESEAEGQYTLAPTFRDTTAGTPATAEGEKTKSAVRVSLFAPPEDDSHWRFFNRCKIISGVLQLTLREDYGFLMMLRDKAEKEDRLAAELLHAGTLVRNPYASSPMSETLGNRLMQIANLEPLSITGSVALKQRYVELLFGKAKPKNRREDGQVA
jgi:hypothetical protein